jgi:hypothetical protein
MQFVFAAILILDGNQKASQISRYRLPCCHVVNFTFHPPPAVRSFHFLVFIKWYLHSFAKSQSDCGTVLCIPLQPPATNRWRRQHHSMQCHMNTLSSLSTMGNFFLSCLLVYSSANPFSRNVSRTALWQQIWLYLKVVMCWGVAQDLSPTLHSWLPPWCRWHLHSSWLLRSA